MAQLQSPKRQAQKRDHRIASSADASKKGEMLLLKPEQVPSTWRQDPVA
jgi:hypothetical protein